jgi:hypothetical protein
VNDWGFHLLAMEVLHVAMGGFVLIMVVLTAMVLLLAKGKKNTSDAVVEAPARAVPVWPLSPSPLRMMFLYLEQ